MLNGAFIVLAIVVLAGPARGRRAQSITDDPGRERTDNIHRRRRSLLRQLTITAPQASFVLKRVEVNHVVFGISFFLVGF